MSLVDPAYRRLGPAGNPSDYRGALVLPEDASGRVLLQQRDDIEGIVAPGLWGLFGGEIEAGEHIRAAAAREFAEETGIERAPEEFIPHVAVVSNLPPFGLLYVHRVASPVAVSDVQLREGSGFAFCTPRQARALDLIPHLRDMLEDFFMSRDH